MKKLILNIALLLTGLYTYSQSNSIFDKYEDNDEVTTVVVNKQAFMMLKKISSESKEAQEYKRIVDGLNELKVFTTENSKVAVDMKGTFDTYIKNKSLVELMRVKDKEANVKIYVRQGKTEDYVSEFVMLVDEMEVNQSGRNPELVIITLSGNINLNDISKITSDINLPGSQHVKEAKK